MTESSSFYSTNFSFSHITHAVYIPSCSHSVCPADGSLILASIILTWPNKAWGLTHCLMNGKTIIFALLPAAPVDACVLNNTVIGVSHAENHHSSFILEHFRWHFQSFIWICVCLYRQGRGWWWMCVHTVSVWWRTVSWGNTNCPAGESAVPLAPW